MEYYFSLERKVTKSLRSHRSCEAGATLTFWLLLEKAESNNQSAVFGRLSGAAPNCLLGVLPIMKVRLPPFIMSSYKI